MNAADFDGGGLDDGEDAHHIRLTPQGAGSRRHDAAKTACQTLPASVTSEIVATQKCAERHAETATENASKKAVDAAGRQG
ncbi:hypothetical protein [Tistrella mobilis]|uniref:hypothetical protein n=1 Tax=Tistrella mobilis TaxID=171437 RepID=UPI0011AE205D|nr:hypothetical protein [Tistrella mobilis]